MTIKLDKLREEFSEGVVEDNYYRIGNIFFFLKAKRTFVYLNFDDVTYRGRILSIDDKNIHIIFPLFEERRERRGILAFEALNRYYSVEILILQSERGVLNIQFPVKMVHLVRRLYPRVSFDDLFVRFIILYSPIFITKEDERNFENNHPHFFQEIQQDSPSLRVLYQMVAEVVRTITPNFELVMLSELNSEDYTDMEKMVIEQLKNVLIYDTSNLESYIKEPPIDILSNYNESYEVLKEEQGKKPAQEVYRQKQKEDLNEFILSYFASPITLFDKPIGYLRMQTSIFDKHSIAPYQAQEVVRILEIFSYSITKIRIRNSHFDPSSFQTRVVNISMSGLLMEITDIALYEYLKKNRRIKMHVPIFDDELEIFGEINRFYEEDGVYFLGVLFFKTRPGDMEKLENFLYDNIHYQFF
ncbi:MAG: DUF1577 domain-containing protein [Leptospirales bacterium]